MVRCKDVKRILSHFSSLFFLILMLWLSFHGPLPAGSNSGDLTSQWKTPQRTDREKREGGGIALQTHTHTLTGLHTSVRQPSSQENPWLTFTQIHRSHTHTHIHWSCADMNLCSHFDSHKHASPYLQTHTCTRTLQRGIVTWQAGKTLRTHIGFFSSETHLFLTNFQVIPLSHAYF